MTFQEEQRLKPRGIYISHLGPDISGFKQVWQPFIPQNLNLSHSICLFVCLLITVE